MPTSEFEDRRSRRQRPAPIADRRHPDMRIPPRHEPLRKLLIPIRLVVAHTHSLNDLKLADFFCILEEMPRRTTLNDLELLILLALIRLAPEAYGVPIAREIAERGKRSIALGTVYVVLERLEQSGLASSTLGEATSERGGRSKRFFHITPAGLAEVRACQDSFQSMWKGLRALKGGAA